MPQFAAEAQPLYTTSKPFINEVNENPSGAVTPAALIRELSAHHQHLQAVSPIPPACHSVQPGPARSPALAAAGSRLAGRRSSASRGGTKNAHRRKLSTSSCSSQKGTNGIKKQAAQGKEYTHIARHVLTSSKKIH